MVCVRRYMKRGMGASDVASWSIVERLSGACAVELDVVLSIVET